MSFKGTTHIGVCMDRSGSMGPLREDTIGGFNAWLTETRKAAKGQDVRLTLQQFDHEHLWLYSDCPIEQVRKLNTDTYVPRGSTALRDAIGQTIGRLEEASTRKDRVLVVIVTDGFENASLEVSAEGLRKMITNCEARKNWTFTYLGANQDAFAVGQAMGIHRGSTLSTVDTAQGTRAAYNVAGAQASSFLAGDTFQAAQTHQVDYDEAMRVLDEDEKKAKSTPKA